MREEPKKIKPPMIELVKIRQSKKKRSQLKSQTKIILRVKREMYQLQELKEFRAIVRKIRRES
jgi:hypothetical protein